MAKSFTVSLDDYALSLPIGGQGKRLARGLDVIDLISVLTDEGFSNITYGTTYHRMYGDDLNSFREQIAEQAIGIPREATVSLRSLGGIRGKFIVTFDY